MSVMIPSYIPLESDKLSENIMYKSLPIKRAKSSQTISPRPSPQKKPSKITNDDVQQYGLILTETEK